MGAFCRGGAQAQQDTSVTAPPTQVDMTATLQALQTAVDNKDSTAIVNLLNSVPRDRQGPLATRLLTAAQNITLAALAFVSGGMATAQTTAAIAVVRNAPSRLAVANQVVTENQDQIQANPN
jgi:hypothetical protein